MLGLGLKMSIGCGNRVSGEAAAAVRTADLQMWHKMNATTWTGSDRLPDSSSNTNTAAMYTGRGLDFDGVNDYVDIGDADVTCKSIVLYINPATTTEDILQLTSSIDVKISSGTLTATGWTSPTEYVNGAASDTVSATTWQQIAITSATGFTVDDLEIGRIATSYYDGGISNIKIFDEELSAAQVLELYNNPEQILPTGLSSGDLVGWWSLVDGDSAGIALNGSGDENIGTLNGAAALLSLPSPVNQISLNGSRQPMCFDGTDNHINLGDFSNFNISNKITFYVKFSAESINFYDSIGSCCSDNSWDDGFGFYFDGTGQLNFFVNLWNTYNANSTALSANTLYYAFGVYDGSNVIVNVSGTKTTGASLTANVIDPNDDVRLFNIKGVASYHTEGVCFESAIWNTNISDSDISDIIAGTKVVGEVSAANLQGHWINYGTANSDWLDKTLNNNDGTVNGSPSSYMYLPEGLTSDKDIFGIDLNNTNTEEAILKDDDYISVSDDSTLDITTNITLEAWVKAFSVSSEQTIIGKNLAYALKITSGAKPAFSKYTTTETETATTSTTLSADTWYHLAVTYDGANVKIYINGSIDTTTAVTGAIDTNSNDVLIGALTSSTENFDGYIDSVKVYDAALSATDILNNYNAESSNYS